MTKSKNTKRALLMSVLSMMLCMAMLAGSTFAWFTDSVTSGKNRIVAGNLDVELYFKNAWTEKQKDANDNPKYEGGWANASKESIEKPMFFVGNDGETIKWEPGVMAVTQFEVANVGSLALKYSLETIKAGFNSLLEVVKDEKGKDVEKYHDLSEVIKFAVVDGTKTYETRDAVLADNLTFGDFTSFTAGGWLLPQDVEDEKYPNASDKKIFTVVAYWEPNVKDDNLYNANNGKIAYTYDEETKTYKEAGKELYIDIEISLAATQTPYEQDSFDENYDAGLYPPEEDGSYRRTLNDNTVVYYLTDGGVLLYDTKDVSIGEDGVYTVPSGVTSIGVRAFSNNPNIKEIVLPSSVNELCINAFRETTAERIVLNEGLTSIGERVFRDANNLKSVVIPTTVTKIEKQAFQLCGLTELIIPATVTTIEEGAFRDMPNLKTLTIEGNPTIANFAGRSCKNLETVILTGDDVTFTGTSQVFTHADTGDAAGITIHVANETVESRLRVAQGSARNYEIVVGTNG